LTNHDNVIAPSDNDSETQRKTQQKKNFEFDFARHFLAPTNEFISIMKLIVFAALENSFVMKRK